MKCSRCNGLVEYSKLYRSYIPAKHTAASCKCELPPLVENDPLQSMADALAMWKFFHDQREWSYETFGPPSFKGPKGPLDHLKKEAAEAYDETDPQKRKMELVDCLFLVYDAVHREGMTFAELVRLANEKLAINKARVWPDWRGTDPDKAIEHDRSHDDPER